MEFEIWNLELQLRGSRGRIPRIKQMRFAPSGPTQFGRGFWELISARTLRWRALGGCSRKVMKNGGIEEKRMTAEVVQGGCLCGAVRFDIRPPTQVSAHCHCSMCRRAHGAAFVTWVRLPKEQLTIVAAEDKLLRYRSSPPATRSFCAVCGSSLFFESEDSPETVDVAFANIDGPIDRNPQLHVFFDDRVDWIQVGDDLPRLGGKTGLEPLT